VKLSLPSLVLLLPSLLLAQQPPASVPPPNVGQVNGHVTCGDTGQPGRFAAIQLLAEKPSTDPILDPAKLGKNPDFGKTMAAAMNAVMKGNNLSALSGMDGAFSLEKVPPGTYYVIAQMPGYLSPLNQLSQMERMKADEATLKSVESQAEKIVVQPNQSAQLRLERGAALSGTIRYDDGSPAPGVAAVLIEQDKDGKWKDLSTSILPISTDDRGHYRLFGLPPGKYGVKAALPTTQASIGLGPGSMAMHMNTGDALVVYSGGVFRDKDVKPIEIGNGDETDGIDITFPISGLHTVSGSVVAKSDNHPIDTGAVTLLDADTKAVLRSAMLDKDGNFHLNYIPDGSYTIKVSGAADMEKSAAGEDDGNDLSRMLKSMGSKPLKSYGDAEQALMLKSDNPTIVLQVPDLQAKATPGGN